MERLSRAGTAVGARLRAGDPWVLISALCLAAVGLVMVYSASSALAGKRYHDSAYFFKHQLFHLALGLVLMYYLARRDYHHLKKVTYPLLALVLLALVLVLIPGVGHLAGGARRWLRLGLFSLQPAELAKPALVLYLAYALSEHAEQVKSFSRGFLPPLFMAGVLTLPVLLEPDLGMSVTLFALTGLMLFVAGTRVTYLLGLVLSALPPLYFLLFKVSFRAKRLTAFLSPWDDPAGAGYQIIHSLLALASGGLYGVGLGGSMQKLFYLPEPHTDFIFAVLGEEGGLLAVLLVLGLFSLLIWRGIGISFKARDLFGTYLALGATLIIGLQAFVNAAVVMGLLPTKGLTLPFISYGGSSLLVNFACVGILLSVAEQSRGSS